MPLWSGKTRTEWQQGEGSERYQTELFEYVDHFYLRHLQRMPLHTPYAAITARVEEIVRQLPPFSCLAVVDQTGVGRPVVEQMFHLPMTPVTITSSQTGSHDRDGWRVGKRILVSNAQVLLQNKRLRAAKGLKLVDQFVAEMLAFRVKISAHGNQISEAREGAHDDLVLAVCLAVWWGTRQQTGWLPNAPCPDLDEDGAPHQKARQPQDIVSAETDPGLAGAIRRYGR